MTSVPSIRDIDERLDALRAVLVDYREGREPAISPLDARALIDELLDTRNDLVRDAAYRRLGIGQ